VSFYKDLRVILNAKESLLTRNKSFFNFDFSIHFLRLIYFISTISSLNDLEKFLIPVVYVKTTLHNIFVYFTMNGKIL
jgi:hypothetical protein